MICRSELVKTDTMGNNESTYRKIAARVQSVARKMLQLAQELIEIADDINNSHLPEMQQVLQVPTIDDVHTPDLFSGLEKINPTPLAESHADAAEAGDNALEHQEQPKRRTYQRNGKRMTEAMMVDTYTKMGKAQGYCARNDIERTLARITGRSREDVREAVNRTAQAMQITCVKSRSYRYYPRSLRAKIINLAVEELEWI